MSDKKIIQDAIKRRLREVDPTPYAIAAAAGVSPDTVYAVERGGGARTESVNAILEALDLVVVPSKYVTRKGVELGYAREEARS
tara:strand:+ start:12600 stop:12851 length:252 start_codon:yes stop_codon:yes gene_type:complete